MNQQRRLHVMNRTKKAGLSVKSGLSLMCIVCLLCGLLCGFFWLAGESSALAAGPDGRPPAAKGGGAGKINHQPCPRCGGRGAVRKNQTIKVKIPAGIDDGQSFRVRDEGNAGSNGGPNGDLLVTVSVRKHPIFTRDGANVMCQMPISFTQAALGASIEVPTLDGKVRYQIPEGTQTGTTFRLRGKGIPYVGYKTRGDQFVTVVVETPTKLTREQKELLKQLESSVGDDGQPKRKSFFDKLKG